MSTKLNHLFVKYYLGPEETTVQFEKTMYNVREDVTSEDTTLYVCLIADNVLEPFTVSLFTIPGTATGIHNIIIITLYSTSVIIQILLHFFHSWYGF